MSLEDTMQRLGRSLSFQRDKSKEKALEEFPLAKEQADAAGLELVVSNDGHHWRFLLNGELVLNFWPASAKAMKKIGKPFRCRGWRHALSVAKYNAEALRRCQKSWSNDL